ncbi:LytR C-terminal domain-containing protein [Rhodoluna sp.]|uniref:LytR C-terminal domain-containing protein n=1 Tax=Rhodoluna sp. TaxID=1969481 RepID=UPI0025FB8DF1|nr:LytR C-terminal domain-containing protein [Rhodoluna sp.]
MAKKFPIDEFDSATQHGGRHRVRRTAKDRVYEWVRIFVAAAVIAVIGYGALKLVESSTVFDGVLPQPSASASQSAPGVKLLDGTAVEAKVTKASTALIDGKFNFLGAAKLQDADGTQISIEKTLIVITDEVFRSQASEVAALFGDAPIQVSTEFAGPITVVLGKDFK